MTTRTTTARRVNSGFRLRHVARSGMSKPMLSIGIALLVVLLILGLLVPLFASSATQTHPSLALRPPSGSHIFGTDRYGRDVFVRCMAAIRIDLLLAVVVAACAFVIGSLIGAISGMAGRYVDEVIMRLTDILMAFPSFVLALVITASLGNSTSHAVIGITIAYTPYFIRLTRSRALSVSTLDFVAAARLAGTGRLRTAVVHVLPNSMQPALVQASLVAAWAILDIAGLSFLGVGVQPPTPEWGAMIADGYSDILSGQWWTAFFPGLLILVAATGFHLIGDALDGGAS
jgi:peptide/nickel transport system permease protein